MCKDERLDSRLIKELSCSLVMSINKKFVSTKKHVNRNDDNTIEETVLAALRCTFKRILVKYLVARVDYSHEIKRGFSRKERKIAGVAGQTVALTLLGSSARPTQ